MALISVALKGDPSTVAARLTTIAASNSIKVIEKAQANSQLIVIYDNAGSTAQTIVVLKGDAQTVVNRLNALIGTGKVIGIVTPTTSQSQYLVVYT